jgi:hypothetical protein
MRLRALAVAVTFPCVLAACFHNDKRPTVVVSVFEDYVTIGGVRSDAPIQQAVDAQTQGGDVRVVFVTSQLLSAKRRDELQRSIDKTPHSGEIGVRKVALPCPPTASSSCR